MTKTLTTIASLLIITSIALLLTFFLIPMTAGAQAGGLVPCSGPDCQICHVLQLANNVMEFVVLFSIVLAAAGITYAGFLYVTNGGNTSQIDRAHKVFTAVALGFVFVLAAWIIVATVSRAFLDDGGLPWDDIECVDQQEQDPYDPVAGGYEPPPIEPNEDYDSDTILNQDDNCPYHANTDQADEDGDGEGDVCDQNAVGEGRCGPVPENEWDARVELNDANIFTNDHGTCREDNVRACRTYVGGLNSAQVNGLKRMRAVCSFTLTGAAETECHSSTSRHYTGRAVDVSPTKCVRDYVNSNGDEFHFTLYEGSHWHLEFK